jgi:porphobilinogen synthase
MTRRPSGSNPFLRAKPQEASASSTGVLGAFPQVRMRRNRSSAWSRRLVAETTLSVDDFIWPVFVQEDAGTSAVESMPGVLRYGPDRVVDAIGPAIEAGIPAVEIFPYLEADVKTSDCREAVNPENLVCRAVRAVKAAFPDLGIVTDVALDPFNSDGHDGLVKDGVILNDETLELLAQQAMIQARAGSDIVAPSDMMDGRVGAIRRALDEADLTATQILSYSAKYASAFYSPFREAVGSGGFLAGDKKTYQMDPANSDEALREVALDLDEGADMVMIKPGLPYLDIIRRVKETFAVPTFVYQVSGEYAMMKAAAANGWLDNDRIILESLQAFKRAGADAILTYAAPEAAALLKAGN